MQRLNFIIIILASMSLSNALRIWKANDATDNYYFFEGNDAKGFKKTCMLSFDTVHKYFPDHQVFFVGLVGATGQPETVQIPGEVLYNAKNGAWNWHDDSTYVQCNHFEKTKNTAIFSMPKRLI